MKLPLGRIAEYIGGSALPPFSFDRETIVSGYSIDSRTLKPGELFFAVKGEHLDGHDFVESAILAGAAAAVVSRKQAGRFATPERLLLVEDPLLALQTLATAVRKLWAAGHGNTTSTPSPARLVIAITGSAGKTTTKEAIASLLSLRFRVLKSEGNLNNHFGLPMQLLRLEPEHELAVVEMGMSHSGEIAALARIAQPDVGVVTCVAPVHLGYFESVAEIARAKYELIQGLPPGGAAILNADDEYVSQFGRDFQGRVVTFAIRHPADIRAGGIQYRGLEGSSFEVVAGDLSVPAHLQLIGEHNIYNALAAISVALECGVPLQLAAPALSSLVPPDKRGQILHVAGATVVNDCYNSNPKALDSMVDALATMCGSGAASQHSRCIVVAGEMLELGSAGDELHRRSGRHMAERKIDILVGVRGAARHIVEAAREAGLEAVYEETPEAAGEWLAHNVQLGDFVLLKASRGVRLERALETWKSHADRTEARADEAGSRA